MNLVDTAAYNSLTDPLRLDGLAFPTPWSARAFGIVLTAAQCGLFSLNEFQQALIVEIADFEQRVGPVEAEDVYYSRWVNALKRVLSLRGLVHEPSLLAAEQAIRDARAAHPHPHPHHHAPDDDPVQNTPSPIFREIGQ
ncbi:nitrile hydratase accessory protein [Paraburkholderia silvatlantica]|uniref:Nitrile hydratase accessory protein n=1 Tax=Paraburkholderia silvatlantica TaxID=321895 RepID=A0A2V4TKS0_9BURK|nr:nitrile hydratase accessory protein [Paraburkholderia silvatlantica]PYE15704.1 nitrile hydratase accessory protein [Paraburkholderia silvatlantica]